MKRKFILILRCKSVCFSLVAVFAALNLTASSTPAQTYEAFVEKRVSEIRVEVNAINKNAATFSRKTKNLEGISLEGTEATYFYSGRNLQKITARIYGETYNATAELYYKNGELLFAFVKRNEYDTQVGMKTPPKVVRTEEQRFYFRSDGELIRLRVGGKEFKDGDKKYSELKDEIISLSGRLKDS